VPGGGVHVTRRPARGVDRQHRGNRCLEGHHPLGAQRVHLLGAGCKAEDDPRTPHSPDPGGAGGWPAPALLLAGVQAPRPHRQLAAQIDSVRRAPLRELCPHLHTFFGGAGAGCRARPARGVASLSQCATSSSGIPSPASPRGENGARAVPVERLENSNAGTPRWSSISSPGLSRRYGRKRLQMVLLMTRETMRSAEIGPKTGPKNRRRAASATPPDASKPASELGSRMALAGLEPATSWVRSKALSA
jgi:hypothetical protein